MKKLSFTSGSCAPRKLLQSYTVPLTTYGCKVSSAGLMMIGLLVSLPATVAANGGASAPVSIAQSVPSGLPPIPYDSGVPFPNEQFVVLVNGNSNLLLQQVRQVEPGAFVNFIDGSSVIQAGRFNSFQNAQFRTDELALLGIGAQVKSTMPTSAPIAVTEPTHSIASTPTGDLPPVPTTVVPVEFGQSPNAGIPVQPQTVAPPPTSPYPSSTIPSFPQASTSGYYVVIPGRAIDLPALANQLIGLGVPANLVQTRTDPRGPHAAIGPYADQGIAREWSQYLRDQGLGARVYFE